MAGEKGKRKTPGQRKPPWPVSYTPRVVVKFHDNVQLPDEDAVDRYPEERNVGLWRREVLNKDSRPLF